VKDRTATIIYARKIVTKHSYMDGVKAKAKEMQRGVQVVKDLLSILFQKGLPSFWDNSNKLIPQQKYHEMLNQARMDASHFDDLDTSLSGTIVINKLSDNF